MIWGSTKKTLTGSVWGEAHCDVGQTQLEIRSKHSLLPTHSAMFLLSIHLLTTPEASLGQNLGKLILPLLYLRQCEHTELAPRDNTVNLGSFVCCPFSQRAVVLVPVRGTQSHLSVMIPKGTDCMSISEGLVK